MYIYIYIYTYDYMHTAPHVVSSRAHLGGCATAACSVVDCDRVMARACLFLPASSLVAPRAGEKRGLCRSSRLFI